MCDCEKTPPPTAARQAERVEGLKQAGFLPGDYGTERAMQPNPIPAHVEFHAWTMMNNIALVPRNPDRSWWMAVLNRKGVEQRAFGSSPAAALELLHEADTERAR